MSDDQIHEYLRSRSDGPPPPDLLDEISRSVATRQQERGASFMRFVPGVAGVALAAAVVVAAIVLVQDPPIGPEPSSSASQTSTPDASVVSRPSPTPAPSAEAGNLTDPGSRVTIPAEDADGSWGSITLERLSDLGGLREILEVDLDEANPDPSAMYYVNDSAMFYLEVAVDYLADREPDPLDFGSDDWLVLGGSEPIVPIEVGFDALPGNLPGAMAVVGDRIGGIVRFAIPRDLATTELILAYRPTGFDDPVWTSALRAPGAPPDPFTMRPPEPIVYVEQPGLPISVIDSSEADALFEAPDTCTNPVAGYTVSYPDDWYTNTEIGPWPACSWFSPVFFEVEDPEVVPEEVAIAITYHPDSGPFGVVSVAVAGGAVEVGGRAAARAEYVGVGGGFIEIGSFLYQYNVAMEGQAPQEGETGDTLLASASWAIEDDPAAYRTATAVLDRIMASLTFGE